MELTQQIELTQESDENYNRIAFLGICGTNYPLTRGPNKIGRDSNTCNIVVDLNSISRLHAMIIVHKHECTLMDLGSSNKTQLGQKILHPYVASPLKHGDAILFGRVAAVFCLVEEGSDLGMTQVEMPDTPVPNRCVSKLNTHTIIPESPDVSDKDESFIGISQTKSQDVFKTPKPRFQARTQNKIDNAYWASSKKSDSFTSEANSSANLNNLNPLSINDMETQLPCDNIICTKVDQNVSLEIHDMETQLPAICKIDSQQDVQLNLGTDNKENENKQLHFDSQFIGQGNVNSDVKSTSINGEKSMDDVNTSSDVISFDEIEDVFSEHSPKPQTSVEPLENFVAVTEKSLTIEETVQNADNPKKPGQNMSNDTMDSDDDIYIAMTQNILKETDYVTDCEEDEKDICKKANNDCETDCEDDEVLFVAIDQSELNLNNKDKSSPNSLKCPGKKQVNLSTVNFKKHALEEMLTQMIEVDKSNDLSMNVKPTALEDMLTQVIEIDKNGDLSTPVTEKDQIVYIPTQVLEPVTENNVCVEEPSKQIYSEEVILFKKPKPFTVQNQNKELLNIDIQENIKTDVDKDNDDNYYAATQQLYEDLCSQREISPEIVYQSPLKLDRAKNLEVNNSNENKTRKRLIQVTSEIDIKEKVNSFVSNLSNSQIMEVIGVDKTFSPRRKHIKRDHYQDEFTKEKSKKSVKSMDKEVKNSSLSRKDSQSNNDKKSKSNLSITKNEKKTDIRLYLNKKDELGMTEVIPMRSSSRVRKPKHKICDDECQNLNNRSNNLRNSKSSIDSAKYNETDNIPLSELKEKSTTSKSKTYETRKECHEIKNKEIVSKPEDNPRRSKRRKKDEELKDEKNNNKSEPKDIRSTRTRSKKSEDADKKSKSQKNKSKETLNRYSSITDVLEKNWKSSITDSLENKTKSSRSRDKKLHDNNKTSSSVTESTVMEIRRSKRQKATSESGIETSKKLKRSGDNLNYPEAKRIKNVSLRSTPASRVKPQYVLFTVFPVPEVRQKLESLGAQIVSDVAKCTVLLTSKIKRTVKLLCVVGLGKPIVGPEWVQACVDNNTIVEPWLHLIKDSEAEQRFEFSLEACLKGKKKFLSGYNVSSTPNVCPQSSELKLIVECSGGRWKEQGPLWVCVSSRQDSALWPALKKRGAVIVSTEFILAGALRQKLEIERHRLD